MSPEDKNLAYRVAVAIQEFTNVPPEKGVNNFVIEGEIRESRTITDVAIAIFPESNGGRSIAAVAANPEAKAQMGDFYSRILKINLSERVKSEDVEDIPLLREVSESHSQINGLPSIALTFAKYEKTGEDVTVLYVIRGISAATALEELQGKARERLAKLQ